MGKTGVLFGAVCIPEGICPDCGDAVLIIGGEFACCGRPAGNLNLTSFRREVDPRDKRRGLSKQRKEAQLMRQDYKCFYCLRQLGSVVYRNNRPVILRTEFDHLIPIAYSRDNLPDNFVASCHVCNRLKSGFVFDSIAAIAEYINVEWFKRGYSDGIKTI